jgi:hypothetical protein
MRRGVYWALALTLASTAPAAHSQDQRTEVEKRLGSQFTLTKMASDGSDVIKAGSVLVLHKDGLTMCSTDAKAPLMNTYKNGTISIGFKAQMVWSASLGAAGQQTTDIAQRKFVDGEKFWITAHSIQNDGVVLTFYSDPYNDVRYYGQLKFPFPKGGFPPADDMMKSIAEVISVEASEEAAPAPVAAPAPAKTAVNVPSNTPKTIGLGQTKDQVATILGQPQKVANLGAKEIYFYKDMKVIFVNGKVTDIQ